MHYIEFNPKPYGAHKLVLNFIPTHSKILDLGCATGYFAKELKKKSCTVIGVEKEKESALIARQYCKKVIIADLNTLQQIQLQDQDFDYILLLDVLEHLVNRDNILRFIKGIMSHRTRLIISTPNIAHLSVRLRLFFGNFTYQRWGILDENHVHFFTYSTLVHLLQSSGYVIESHTPTADFGQVPFVGRIMRHIPEYLQYKITEIFPTILGVQFIIVCRIK